MCGMMINYKIIKARSAVLQLEGSATGERAKSCPGHFPGKPQAAEHPSSEVQAASDKAGLDFSASYNDDQAEWIT